MDIKVIILTAGKGTRMKSSKPKVLHEIGHAPMYYHVHQSAKNLISDKPIFVTSAENQQIKDSLRELQIDAEIVIQQKQKGTGHAVKVALDNISDVKKITLILYGDTPLILPSTLKRLVKSVNANAPFSFLGFQTNNPQSYGRIFTDEQGYIKKIMEAKEINQEDSSVPPICNSGILCALMEPLSKLLPQISNSNSSREYYLTDIAELALTSGLHTNLVLCDEEETLGINSQIELAAAEKVFQKRSREHFMHKGITMIDPDTVYFSFDTEISPDVIIEPSVHFGKNVQIQSDVVVHSFSYLEGCHVSAGSKIGPYARIRPGTFIAEDSKIGNFVEIKATKLGQRNKVSHLTYVGDAEIGDDTNIGAGTVFCNYDGQNKHKTTIGKGAFIGSNTLLVAPVKVGDHSFTGAGSVITQDVPEQSLSIARARQKNLNNKAPRKKTKLD